MIDVLLCKDCRYAEDVRGRWLCRHPTSVVVPPPDRVTGATREPYPDQCLFVRIDQEMFPTETMRVPGPVLGGA